MPISAALLSLLHSPVCSSPARCFLSTAGSLPAPVRKRKLYFSEDRQDLKDPTKPALYFITVEGKTPRIFDMHASKPDIIAEQGSVEDWVIENRATEAHVFHIHQLHFQVIGRDGRKLDSPPWRDTVARRK